MRHDDAPLNDVQLSMLQRDVCPDCQPLAGGAATLIPGPRGGAARNWACRQCGSEFNVTRTATEQVVFAHRNSLPGRPNRQRLLDVYGIRLGDKADG